MSARIMTTNKKVVTWGDENFIINYFYLQNRSLRVIFILWFEWFEKNATMSADWRSLSVYTPSKNLFAPNLIYPFLYVFIFLAILTHHIAQFLRRFFSRDYLCPSGSSNRVAESDNGSARFFNSHKFLNIPKRRERRNSSSCRNKIPL